MNSELKKEKVSRKKILYLENTAGVGGSAVALYTFLPYLNMEKYQAYLFVPYHKQPFSLPDGIEKKVSPYKLISDSSLLGKIFMGTGGVFGKYGKKIGGFLLFMVNFLTKIFPYSLKICWFAKKRNVDLIHLNNSILSNLSGIIAAKLIGVPCVCHERGFDWDSPTTRWFAKFIDYYIPVSKAIAESLLKFGIDPSKLTEPHEGLKIEEYDFNTDASKQREEFALKQFQPVFGIVGVLLEWKGQHVFLEIVLEVVKVIPSVKAFIVGDSTNKDYKERLKVLVKKLGIENNVVFTGWRQDIPELMQLLDVVVHTSIEPEPCGRVVVEAMAMKKPVVASKAGGPMEIIEDNLSGFLVEPGNVSQYASIIIRLLQNKEEREKIGNAARKRIENKFNILTNKGIVEKVYEKLLH